MSRITKWIHRTFRSPSSSPLLNRLFAGNSRNTSKAKPSRPRRGRLELEGLENRLVPSVTSMTQLGQMFEPHAGPTMIYLNFDGGSVTYQDTGRVVTKVIQPYQAAPGGNLATDIGAIQTEVAKIFAPFNVEVVPVKGAGWFDSSNNGNTTIFIGADPTNASVNLSTFSVTKYAAGSTPSAFEDAPGKNKGYNHQPHSDAFNLAFIDPVGQDGTGALLTVRTALQIAQAIAHEAGHTFGLEHVFTGDGTGKYSSSNPGDLMAYDAPITSFLDMNYSVTNVNYDASKPVPPGYTWNTRGGDDFFAQWNDNGTIDKITTQDSYTYLLAVLGPSMDQVAVASNADGSQVAFAIGSDHGVWSRHQLSYGNNWSTWQSLGGFAEQITVGHNRDGRLEVFAIGGNNAVYHQWQVTPNGGWNGYWANDLSNSYATQIAVANNADGRMELFVVSSDHALYHEWQVAPNSGWNGYWANDLGGYVKQFTVGHNQDGRLEIFAISGDNAVYHQWQVAPNGRWNGYWATDLSNGYLTQIAVGNNADGRMELFGIGGNGGLYHEWQVAPNSGWNGYWATDLSNSYLTQIAVGNNADGRMEVFGIGGDNQAYHVWQVVPNGRWSGWNLLAGGAVRELTVGSTVAGLMEVFAVGADNHLHQTWEIAPNSSQYGWIPWVDLGGYVV